MLVMVSLFLFQVWEALLQDMPMTAMLRNLGKMTSLGLFQKPENLKIVVDALSDTSRLQKARIHPIKVNNFYL